MEMIDLRPLKEFSKRLKDPGLRKSIQQEPDLIDSDRYVTLASVWLPWVESSEGKSL